MPGVCVKSALVVLLPVASLWRALCDERSYHAEITAARSRYLSLENRKAMGGSLSAAEEKERQCLLGQLIDQDPLFVLTREIAKAQALELGSDTSEERATIERLTVLWQIATQFESSATTLPEAKAFANTLRKFVARRDVDGARAWANAQKP